MSSLYETSILMKWRYQKNDRIFIEDASQAYFDAFLLLNKKDVAKDVEENTYKILKKYGYSTTCMPNDDRFYHRVSWVFNPEMTEDKFTEEENLIRFYTERCKNLINNLDDNFSANPHEIYFDKKHSKIEYSYEKDKDCNEMDFFIHFKDVDDNLMHLEKLKIGKKSISFMNADNEKITMPDDLCFFSSYYNSITRELKIKTIKASKGRKHDIRSNNH